MSVPFLAESKRATTDVVVELSRSQVSLTLPFELRDYVSPNTWDIRVSTLGRLASQYCRPTFERAYLVINILLTFLVPITTYYATLQALENTTTPTDNIDRQIWIVRFSCFGATIATWIVLSVPVIVWKYLGKIRIKRLVDQWTRSDALSAATYGDAPVWNASPPGFFKNTILLMVTVPPTKKSHFDYDSYLPPYIAAGNDALPPYGDSRVHWWKDHKGGIKYGDLPMYSDKSA